MPRVSAAAGITALVVLVALIGAAWWWSQPKPEAALPAPAPAAAPPLAAASIVEAASSPASAPTAGIVPSAPAAGAAPIEVGDGPVTDALVDYIGRAAVLQLIQADRFVVRVVATVDNLPRGHVAPRLWPLNLSPGRFAVDDEGRIAAGNARRYDASVRLLDGLPPARAADLYRRLYPQLQAAYVELGYPRGSFHARLLAVIDHLLNTPMASSATRLQLIEVKGEVPSQRPWVRYEFADPALQQLSAGQRLLLRLGPAHQARIIEWLRALRPLL
ncbi:MAG: DUF3014 domain-containing protein [Burkholderiaceae bacterium]|nr:DUF3014 domain-containing protein [Aquabacterium sp.]NUP85794.1 DUF3014 domain-containing protein [Burkholderiaceae bacterium]